MKIRLYLLILACFFISPYSVFGQGQTERNWFTANQQWDFSKEGRFPESPVAITNLDPQGNTAVATDGFTGDWHFYTDGQNFYRKDAAGNLITDNLPVKATPTYNQRVAAAPADGSIGADYLFWVNNNGDLHQYRVTIDNDGLAGAAVAEGNPLAFQIAPAMRVIHQMTQGNVVLRLLVQDATTRELVLLDITNGLSEIIRTDAYGATFQNFEWTPPYISLEQDPFDPNNQIQVLNPGKVALTPNGINNLMFANFWFDPANGPLIEKNDREVFNQSAATFYDTEWVNDTTLLISADNAILKFDYRGNTANGNYPNILANKGATSVKGIQMAPDGFIYFLQANNNVGRIRPTIAGEIVDRWVSLTSEFGNGSVAQLNADQFPVFAPPRVEDINVTNVPTQEIICDQQNNQFHPSVTRNGVEIAADAYFWDLGEGPVASVIPTINPQSAPGGSINIAAEVGGVTYFGSGTFNAAQNQLDPNSIIKDTPTDLSSQQGGGGGGGLPGGGGTGGGGAGNQVGNRYVQDTLMCAPPFVGWANDATVAARFWYNRSQEPSDTITDPGNYWVKAYDNGGCNVRASVQVRMVLEEDGGGYLLDTTQQSTIGQWYFGTQPGLDFNTDLYGDNIPQPIEPIGLDDLNAMDDVETVYDERGRAFFVTNGDGLWIADTSGVNFTRVQGVALGGDAEQGSAVAVIQLVEDETKYYVFSTRQKAGGAPGEYEVRYSLIDVAALDLNNGIITITAIAQDVLLMESAMGRLISNQGYLVAHEYGNNNWKAFPVTAQGLGNPVISSTGRVYDENVIFNYGEIGTFDVPDVGLVSKVAVAIKDLNSGLNYLDVYDLNPNPDTYDSAALASGGTPAFIPDVDVDKLYNPIQIPLGDDNLEPYGVEFNGNFVMVSLQGNNNSKVFAADLRYQIYEDNGEDLKPESTQLGEIATTSTGGGGILGEISAAPNNSIYIANQGSNTLKEITGIGNTESGGLNLQVGDSQFSLTSTSQLGLPSFVLQAGQGSGGDPSLEAEDVCLGDSAVFNLNMGEYYTSAGNFTLLWEFGDGNTQRQDTTTEATHLYAEADTYIYKVDWKNHCSAAPFSFNPVLTDTITVNPAIPDDQWGVSDGEKVCQDTELTAFTGDATGYTITWTNRGTVVHEGNVIQVDTENPVFHNEFFLIQVEDPNGCLAEREVLLTTPLVDAGFPDSTYCQNTEDVILSSGASSLLSYQWAVENAPTNSPAYSPGTNTFPVETGTPGDFVYYMQVQDPDDATCFVEISADIKVVGVIDGPTLPLSAACGATTTIKFENNKGIEFDRLTFNWNSPDVVATGDFEYEAEPGAYNVNVIDNLYKCEVNFNVPIEATDFTPNYTSTIFDECNTGSNFGIIRISNPDAGLQFTLIREEDGTEITPNGLDFNNITPGNYTLQIEQNGGGCETSEALVFEENSTEFSLSTDNLMACLDGTPNITLSPIGGGTIDQLDIEYYTASGSILERQEDVNINSIIVDNEEAASATFFATTGVCTFEKTIPVNVASAPEDFEIDQSGDRCDGEVTVFVVDADLAYDYNWAITTAGASTTNNGPNYLATESGNFVITVTDKQTQCQSTLADEVEVAKQIGIALTGETICEGTEAPINIASLTVPDFTEDLLYQWYQGSLEDNNVLPDAGATLSYGGADSVIFVVATAQLSGCQDTASFNIQPLPATIINPNILGVNPAYCFFDEDQIPEDSVIYPGQFLSYEWVNLDQDIFLSEESALELSDDEALIGTIKGTFNNAFNCPAEMIFNIINQCKPTVVFPNAFAPRGSFNGNRAERGNIFSVEYAQNLDPNRFIIEIYNRWGEKIFQTEDYETFKDEGWDGTDRGGREMPAGAYSYVARFGSITENSPIEEVRGSVLLIR
ncbi:gliding motility-associated C-terminal domain-containing protein [Persicobacter diffluens]|uniref:PKD domain-containing protein n=1 Tax=Persicobacter diffluens TaxID=981 RepID=A0AAN4VY14_9BACT|nr:hypothetical protein PEDI_18910 [Persicobacter diffluens]